MPVAVNECPASGSPTGRHFSVSYTRTTACSGVVALQAVAASLRLEETAREMDCIEQKEDVSGGTGLLARNVPRNRVQTPFRSRAKG